MRSDRTRPTAGWGQGGNAAELIRLRGVNSGTLQNRRLKWTGSSYSPTTEVIEFFEPDAVVAKQLDEGDETWVIFRQAANRYEEVAGGDSGNVIYAQAVGAVTSGDPTFTFDNAIAIVGSIPTGGTGTAQNQYAQSFSDNDWVLLFQEKSSDQWLTERGGESGSQVVYFEITEHKVYGDAAVLAKPVLADGTMDAGADEFYVVDEKNMYYGRAAESGADGYRGFGLRYTDDYSEGVPGFRIISMQGPAQWLIVDLDAAYSGSGTDCNVLADQPWGRPFRGQQLPPTGVVEVQDDLSVAASAAIGDKWLVAWDEAEEHYIFVLPLEPFDRIVIGMVTATIGAATMDGTAITCTPGITTSAVTKLQWDGADLEADGSAIHGVNFSKTALRASTAEPLIVTGVIKKDIPDVAEAFVVYSVYDLRMLPSYTAANDQSIGHDAAGGIEWQDDTSDCPE